MAVTAVIVNRRVTPRADQLTHAVRRIWSLVPVHLTSPENNSTVSECGQNSSDAISNIRGGLVDVSNAISDSRAIGTTQQRGCVSLATYDFLLVF